jgi:hypothetical protein
MVNNRRKTVKVILTKTALNSKLKVREKLETLLPLFEAGSQYYSKKDIFQLILSLIRANEMNVVDISETKSRTLYNIDTEKIIRWIEKKLVPNTILISVDDKELLKLLIFSLAMPYKMLRGETRATMSEKVRRGKERGFEQIFSDTFVGKLGEVALKQFAKEKLGIDISLDWQISTEIESFRSDIIGSKKIVSIKSTDTLESIWAEAPKGADYGILVKVGLPKDFLMKILAHISSLEKLLKFVEERVEKDISGTNTIKLVDFIKEVAYEEKMTIKTFIPGFFKTKKSNFKHKGDILPYIGGEFEVFGDKHLIKCNKLKFSKKDWNDFFKDIFGE